MESILVLEIMLPIALLAVTGLGAGFVLLRRVVAQKHHLPGAVSQDNRSATQPDIANVPMLIWTERSGLVVWKNLECTNVCGQEFQGIAQFQAAKAMPPETNSKLLRLVSADGSHFGWYDVSHQCENGVIHYFAVLVEKTVLAEEELNRFLQTLTATFGHLPVGLAVFDRSRDLVLFNPAVSNLLRLSPEWLAKRPSLREFLEKLRNEGMLPEPKDFESWRNSFTELEQDAISDNYQEDWNLPDGSVYRVHGQPHPKGGVALVFEDISKAVTLERSYRAELENLQRAFDCMPEAVAILDSGGDLMFANEAFDALWCVSASTSVIGLDALHLSRIWQERCMPTPAWGDFRDFIRNGRERSQWDAEVTLLGGQILLAVFSPLAGGQVFCEFSPAPHTEFATKEIKKMA